MTLCECGCGRPAPVAQRTDRTRGYVRGEPMRFIIGHNKRKPGARYVETDCGFTSPCWIWQLSKIGAGYGRLQRDGVKHLAHRWYYEQRFGPVPDGLELDHLCGRKDCVNPDHLEPVTHVENVRRGNLPKLTAEAVAEIRGAEASDAELAETFSVAEVTVNLIRRYPDRYWRDAVAA